MRGRERRAAVAAAVARYRAAGVRWSDWARRNGFKYQAVRDVVRGRSACSHGEAFRVAVAMGAIPEPPPELRHLSGGRP